ncbi:MAG: hypothetical protein Q8R10_11925 [Pseudomonas sp.]|nr:hypothetical protein [Pseudomonas sp.]MDP3847117.1 hypothetical protein [Pseudomonas sp.]
MNPVASSYVTETGFAFWFLQSASEWQQPVLRESPIDEKDFV